MLLGRSKRGLEAVGLLRRLFVGGRGDLLCYIACELDYYSTIFTIILLILLPLSFVIGRRRDEQFKRRGF